MYTMGTILKTAKEKMTRRSNNTYERLLSQDSYQTPNYANLVPQNPLQVTAQPQPTFVNAFHQSIEIYPLDPDQTIATPEKISSFAIKAVLVLLAGLSGQKTQQIDFYSEDPSEGQVIEAKQRARVATDLVTWKRPSKHNNQPVQPIFAFDQILTDLEAKLAQQYKQLQRTLTLIVKGNWTITLKFNLNSFVNIFDTTCKALRISFLPYTIEIDQQQRQSKRQLSSLYGRIEESQEVLLQEEVIPEITVPHLQPYLKDTKKAQLTWLDRCYDLIGNSSVIQYKNTRNRSHIKHNFTWRSTRTLGKRT
ncbi:MAG: hypothetical protein EZS28_002841 [Streblomastix strix]|uniref:Uncharacterized protein n=1 Tax=Streblomastix strix TaxID=222440 RepID=A0A5J4X525_9EUKA|nr:MAG: hypothetical protein EZS28_002841 [Streblomastix strix]